MSLADGLRKMTVDEVRSLRKGDSVLFGSPDYPLVAEITSVGLFGVSITWKSTCDIPAKSDRAENNTVKLNRRHPDMPFGPYYHNLPPDVFVSTQKKEEEVTELKRVQKERADEIQAYVEKKKKWADFWVSDGKKLFEEGKDIHTAIGEARMLTVSYPSPKGAMIWDRGIEDGSEKYDYTVFEDSCGRVKTTSETGEEYDSIYEVVYRIFG